MFDQKNRNIRGFAPEAAAFILLYQQSLGMLTFDLTILLIHGKK